MLNHCDHFLQVLKELGVDHSLDCAPSLQSPLKILSLESHYVLHLVPLDPSFSSLFHHSWDETFYIFNAIEAVVWLCFCPRVEVCDCVQLLLCFEYSLSCCRVVCLNEAAAFLVSTMNYLQLQVSVEHISRSLLNALAFYMLQLGPKHISKKKNR